MNSKKNPFDPDRCRRLRVSLRAAAEKALSQYDPRLAARFDPSDLVQDALLRAYLSIHTWRGSSEKDLFAWARRILDNVLANEIRAAMAGRRDVRRTGRLSEGVGQESSALGLDPEDPKDSNPARRMQAAEALASLVAALASLEEDKRRALVLHRVEGLSIEQVASRLSRSPTAAARLIRRALEEVRKRVPEI